MTCLPVIKALSADAAASDVSQVNHKINFLDAFLLIGPSIKFASLLSSSVVCCLYCVLRLRPPYCILSRYLENVPAIVPLLEKEFRNAAKRLEDTQDELNDLNPQK